MTRELDEIRRLAAQVIDDNGTRASMQLARLALGMLPLVQEVLDCVDGDGSLPGSLCNAAVRFRRQLDAKEQP